MKLGVKHLILWMEPNDSAIGWPVIDWALRTWGKHISAGMLIDEDVLAAGIEPPSGRALQNIMNAEGTRKFGEFWGKFVQSAPERLVAKTSAVAIKIRCGGIYTRMMRDGEGLDETYNAPQRELFRIMNSVREIVRVITGIYETPARISRVASRPAQRTKQQAMLMHAIVDHLFPVIRPMSGEADMSPKLAESLLPQLGPKTRWNPCRVVVPVTSRWYYNESLTKHHELMDVDTFVETQLEPMTKAGIRKASLWDASVGRSPEFAGGDARAQEIVELYANKAGWKRSRGAV